jgi:hypothetical protein
MLRSQIISKNTLMRLVASYESVHSLNPLEKTRRESVIIVRQCLSYILYKKYRQTCSHLGSIMECNHATILHSARVVDNALEWKDNLFIQEINNWAKIFTEVMPNSEETKSELVETINNHLNTTMLSPESKIDVLKKVMNNLNI